MATSFSHKTISLVAGPTSKGFFVTFSDSSALRPCPSPSIRVQTRFPSVTVPFFSHLDSTVPLRFFAKLRSFEPLDSISRSLQTDPSPSLFILLGSFLAITCTTTFLFLMSPFILLICRFFPLLRCFSIYTVDRVLKSFPFQT